MSLKLPTIMPDKLEKGNKKLAVRSLLGFSIITFILLSVISTISFFHTFQFIKAGSFVLVSGALLVLTAIILTLKEKYDLAKFIVILVPPYTLMAVSIIIKSNGLLQNLYTFLTPKFFAILFLMGPIMFFGLRQKRNMLVSIFILAPTILLFDPIHAYFGVDVSILPVNHEFYKLFTGMVFTFYMISVVSLLFSEKSNLLFKEKVIEQNLTIEREMAKIGELNKHLKFQSNLYRILNITSSNKRLFFILQQVLDEMLSIDCLDVQHKGLIFLTNAKGHLEIAAHRNVDPLLKSCALVKEGECLCGMVLKTKENYFCDSVGHYHTTRPEGMKPHGHYVVPIKNNDKVLGVINLYVKQGEKRDVDVENFLNGVSIVLARKIVADQNNEKLVQRNIEFKNQGKKLSHTLGELNDSLAYARDLQKSLMPNKITINKHFKESSFLFKPKDKVSGDFYFAHEVGDQLYFGVGDCTGHGIPGSMLASMSLEAVKRVIYNRKYTMPDQILTKLREIAKLRFSVNNDEGRTDSMDAALCMYERKTEKLYYSGGFINLIIVRNNSEVLTYKATKSPIGSYPIEREFELNEIDLQKGDVLYLMSDGYVDQFGYPEGDSNRQKPTKFKIKQFKSLITTISHLSCDEQVKILKENLKKWRGDIEQIDDVTVFIAKNH